MLTHPLLTVPWHAASRRGPRQINADATATYHDPDTGRSAFVVADGVGDTWAAASAAQLAAGIAARAAVTVAEYYRARAQPVTPRMAHLVTTSVRTVRPDRIGSTRTSLAAGRLLLCSDGVHRTLTGTDIRTILDGPKPAEQLVDAALGFGGRDNSTALVVEHTLPTEPQSLAA
jgi:serine/threonine protein phosphatase PrpC